MKWVGYRLLDIADITFDAADLEARSKQPHVAELAGSIQEMGEEPMSAPVVALADGSDSAMLLVAGRDRLAAFHFLLGRKEIWCHVGEDFTPRDLLKAEVYENLHRRRDDRDALVARLVATAEAEAPHDGEPVSKQTAKARARAQVAKETGLTHKAVTRAEERAKVSEAAADNPGAGGATPPPPPPPILTFGLELPPEQAEALRAEIKLLEIADAGMRQAVAGLAKAAEALSGAAHGALLPAAARLMDAARELGGAVRGAKPSKLCPWCKGLDALSKNCPTCRGVQVLTEGQLVGFDIPPELTWSEGERVPPGWKSASGKGGAHVAIDGKFVPIAEARKLLDARPAAALPSADGKAPKANGAAAERDGAARPASVTRSRGPAGSPPNGKAKRVMRAIMPEGDEVVVPPPDEGPVRVYDEPSDDELFE